MSGLVFLQLLKNGRDVILIFLAYVFVGETCCFHLLVTWKWMFQKIYYLSSPEGLTFGT